MGSRYMFLLLLVLLLLSTCCSSFTSISWGGCPPEERSALLRLKQQLADPYDQLSSWKGLYCCSWLGIACHRVSGHVARLDLSDYALSAAVKNSSSQIFPALFQLHHLEYLDLSWIDLSPLPFPSHLPMTLTRLTHLSFEGCGLTGRIPSEIGNMSTLEYLDISDNPDLEMRQSGSWIRNMRGLEVLYIKWKHWSRMLRPSPTSQHFPCLGCQVQLSLLLSTSPPSLISPLLIVIFPATRHFPSGFQTLHLWLPSTSTTTVSVVPSLPPC